MTARLDQEALEWVTAKQAAARRGISVRTLTRYQARGLIKAHYTPGGHRRFRTADIDALFEVAESGSVIGGNRVSAAPAPMGAGQQIRTGPTASHPN